jgi:hypothetical protein
MTIRAMSKLIAIQRREKAGHLRLLRAIFPPPPPPLGELDIPLIHPFSSLWNLVELDPQRWH